MTKLWKYDFDIAKYTKAIELNPDNYGAYSNRGIAYQKKGNIISLSLISAKPLN